MLQYIRKRERVLGSQMTTDITDEVSIGINILETADTNNNTLNFIWKTTEELPLNEHVIILIKIQNHAEQQYLVVGDQVDNLNTANNINKVYVHNINAVDPLAFLNTITGESMTHSFFTEAEGLTQLTYLDVLLLLLEKLRINSVVSSSAELTNKLFDIASPEFTFRSLTAREIIEQLLGSLGLIPTLSATGLLSFLEILDSSYNIETITREENRDSSNYLTGSRNIIEKGRNTKVLHYPSIDGFIGPFGNTKIYTAKDESNFILPHKISNVKRVLMKIPATGSSVVSQTHTGTIIVNKANGLKAFNAVSTIEADSGLPDPITVDVTKNVITIDEYNTLLIADRDDKLFYEIGDNKIQGWNIDEDGILLGSDKAHEEAAKAAASRGDTLPDITSSTFKEFNSDGNPVYDAVWVTYKWNLSSVSSLLANLFMNVTYEAQFNAEVKTHKTQFIQDQLVSEKFNTQIEPYLNLENLGQNQRDLLNIAGQTFKSVTQLISDVSDILTVYAPLTADINGRGNVIKRSTTINKNHLIVKYDLLENFKVIPDYGAINNAPRIFQGDTSQTIPRNYIIDNYILIEKFEGSYTPDDNLLNAVARDILNSTLKFDINFGGNDYKQLLPEDLKVSVCRMEEPSTTNQVILGAEPLSIGNTFGWQHTIDTTRFLDGAGQEVERLGDNPFETLPAPYTNDFGRISQIIYKIYNNMTGTNIQYHAIPRANGLTFEQIIHSKIIDVKKDALEELSITNQFSCITNDPDIKIYPALARNARLLTGAALNTKIVRLVRPAQGDERVADVDIDTTINLVYNGDFFDFTFDIGGFGAGSYAVVVAETNEPILAFNNLTIFTSFFFKLITKELNPYIDKAPWPNI